MVDNRLIAISYFCFFMFVYLASIMYSMLPKVFDIEPVKQLPQTAYTTQVYTATSALSMTSSYSVFALLAVVVIVLILFGSISTFKAY